MLARFRKIDYWRGIGHIAGFHQAVEKLGSNWRELDEDSQGYTDANSIWGQLAQLTELKNKHTYEARKWLYNAWHEDRQEVKTKFYAYKEFDQSSVPSIKTSTKSENQSESSNSQVCNCF